MRLGKDNIYKCLRTVIDPELGKNIVDMGLIYQVHIGGKETSKKAKVVMTLTSPGCPLADVLENMILESMTGLDDFFPGKDLELEITFDPPWTPQMMSEEIRLELGLD